MGRKRAQLNTSNATYEEVCTAMKCTPTQEGFVRLQAIKFLYKGCSNELVSNLMDVHLRSVTRWIKDFNDSGIDGVLGTARTGRPRRIEKADFQHKYVDKFLESEQTAISFHGNLLEEFEEALSYSTFLNYLHENDLSRVIGRTECVQRDDEKRAEFIKKFKEEVEQGVNIWFCDEAGFEGNPKPRKKWVRKGQKLKNPYFKLHLRTSVIGAVNPKTGEFFSHVVPHVNMEIFQNFLNELNKNIKDSKEKNIIIIDNASWHNDSLSWGNLQPLYLPPYSPDFNPIERLWKSAKDNYFNGWYAKNLTELDERVCYAMKSFLKEPEKVKSITSFESMLKKS